MGGRKAIAGGELFVPCGNKTIPMKNKISFLLIVGILFFGIISIFIEIQRTRDLKIVLLSTRASYLNTAQSLAAIAALHLEQMIIDAEKDGMCLIVVSGYRSKERQQKIWDEAEDKSIVAIPGKSEHERGLAVDLGGCPMIDGVRNDAGERLELRNDFETLPEYQWLLENASKYGFKQSYTEGNSKRSGFPAEPWHWKFKY
jgi:LAS superfamily LD-carboxypeptidase LdcB